MTGAPLLAVEDLVVEHRATRGVRVQATAGIGFEVREGETLGLVGESGCGKSSTIRALFQLPPPTSGRVVFEGNDLTRLRGRALREARRQMQLVGQDPVGSLNPRRTVAQSVAEPLHVWHRGDDAEQARIVEAVLDAVGLDPVRLRDRYPHQLSGGQCQRVCIARALVLEPRLLVCDEPVSALDVSVQAQILNLLEDTKERYRLSMLFVAHDLAVVKQVSDRVAVMYLGKLCEVAEADEFYAHPAHHYTVALLSAVPSFDPDGERRPSEVAGEQPSPLAPPSGCRFRTRCPRADERCAVEEPLLQPLPGRPGHVVACHYPAD
jgi:peptide/nickel transport system ATP-binding protein